MDGILLIDKPAGWTSFDVVAKVRGIVRKETGQKKPKVGHTGTLDPLATGLLVLVIGKYTKQVPQLSKVDKTYKVTMKLGQTSTTGDEEGEKTQVSDKKPSKEEVLAGLRQFVGDVQQVPPAYSAIKVNGQRAYKLARAGKEVNIEPRTVKIYEITDIHYAYPEVRFVAKVSSGTYIRTLAEDIGKALGTGAYMSGLCRTEVGSFSIGQATDIAGIMANPLRKLLVLDK
ncbi:MAG TPA: tRNA pseudouridine(55) synthase TruB [Candidatus Limnocylindria bacterium]|nr:tRNA pseudouridine(55) synthase TruB [Candidatus Limnocylindria bacterium]